jgi:phage FluMu gp28-like protein
LLPYQRRWVEDNSKLKIVVKARQTGYSFAASIRAFLECLKKKTCWIVLSKGERQSKLLMEKINEHRLAAGIAADYYESNLMEGTMTRQLEIRFGNGSVIYGLPANPDTARGYSGNITCDEFGFHLDSTRIYTALYPTITRGYSLELISTPNGKQGKFYEIAKDAGLVEGEDAKPFHGWSSHAVDVYEAAAQGLANMVPVSDGPLDPALVAKTQLAFEARGITPTARMVRFVVELRTGVLDEDAWLQEACCKFISIAENFFPPELVAACIRPEASAEMPPCLLVCQPGEYYLGIDIGRHHDLTVFWLDRVLDFITHDAAGREMKKPITTARLVRTMRNTPFAEQLAFARELLSLRRIAAAPGGTPPPLVRRACIDATGMGMPLAEQLATEFGARVEPVTFTAAVKEDMAFRTKRLAEGGQIELPDVDAIRRAFGAVKKVVTAAGSIRFDAERTELGHADEFWAKALADLAASTPEGAHLSDGVIVGRPRSEMWMPQALPAVF